MLRLRPYNKNDAEIIMSWIRERMLFINGQQEF